MGGHCGWGNSFPLLYSVLDLCKNQKGVSNIFLTYFDYFFGGSIQTWGLRGTRGG